MKRYVPCHKSQIPEGIRFMVPSENQGQIIEVAYGDFGNDIPCHGAPYQRILDQSIGPAALRYYVLVDYPTREG
jgi:hypothetical protein